MTEAICQAEPRRDELAQRGILKQTSPNVVDPSEVIFEVKLRFCRPNATVANMSNPWDPSCTVSKMFVFTTTC
jgi:hypothetical protein